MFFKKIFSTIAIIALAVMAFSCHRSGSAGNSASLEFPDSLFTDTGFPTLLYKLNESNPDSIPAMVERYLDAAKAISPQTYSSILSLAENSLYDPESPRYDEALYVHFLRYRLSHGENNLRVRYLLDEISRTLPGAEAPDLELTLPDGSVTRLRQPGSQANILLIFYDPDCDSCRKAEETLAADRALADSIAAGRLRIVMLYTGDDTPRWASHARTLPPNWEIARDAGKQIDSLDLYPILTLPTIYCLSPALRFLPRKRFLHIHTEIFS